MYSFWNYHVSDESDYLLLDRQKQFIKKKNYKRIIVYVSQCRNDRYVGYLHLFLRYGQLNLPVAAFWFHR